MPNNTTNYLTIEFKDNLTKDTFRQFIQGKGIHGDEEITDFDFNNIIPMPKHIFKGSLGSDEEKKYGKNNWYDWSWDNWGTKWNAHEIEIDADSHEKLHIDFYTAWSPPIPIFDYLWLHKRSYGIKSIHCEYKDEGYHYEGLYENGIDKSWKPSLEDEDCDNG